MALYVADCTEQSILGWNKHIKDSTGHPFIGVLAAGQRWDFYAGKPVEVPDSATRRLEQKTGGILNCPIRKLDLKNEKDRSLLLRARMDVAMDDIPLDAVAASPSIQLVLPPKSMLDKASKKDLVELATGIPGFDLDPDWTKGDIIERLESLAG
jgi:hypothetical protein